MVRDPCKKRSSNAWLKECQLELNDWSTSWYYSTADLTKAWSSELTQWRRSHYTMCENFFTIWSHTRTSWTNINRNETDCITPSSVGEDFLIERHIPYTEKRNRTQKEGVASWSEDRLVMYGSLLQVMSSWSSSRFSQSARQCIGILRPDLTPVVELWALLLANFYVCYLLCFMLWKRGLKDSPGIRPPRQMRAVRLSQLQGALGLPIHFHFIFTDKGHFLQPYIPLTPSGVLPGRSTKLTHNLR